MNLQGAITSFEQFEQIVDGIRRRRIPLVLAGLPMRWEFYRGQADIDWSVTPGITRGLETREAVQEAQSAVMKHFRQRMENAGYPYRIHLWKNPRGYQDEWSWYIQAQHYRIPTRLLDWSGKPEVALFFAVEKEEDDGIDGAFFVYYNPQSAVRLEGSDQREFLDTPPYSMSGTWFLNPPFDMDTDREDMIAEGRRLIQYGKFTLQDYATCLRGLDKQPEPTRDYRETISMDVPVMEKWSIPAWCKRQLRLDLAARGWYGEYLYLNEDQLINEIQQECSLLRDSFRPSLKKNVGL